MTPKDINLNSNNLSNELIESGKDWLSENLPLFISKKINNTINKSLLKGEINILQAQTAKYVPKFLTTVSEKVLKPLDLIKTVKEYWDSGNREGFIQATFTDGAKFGKAPFVGEIWNYNVDKAWEATGKVAKQYTKKYYKEAKKENINRIRSNDFKNQFSRKIYNNLTLENTAKQTQTKPLQPKGFLNDKNPTQQSFLEQNGLPDMQKQYAHLMNDRTSLNNVYGDRFKAMQDAANQGGNVTGISNSATAARAWINPNPSPMTFLNPEFEDLLSQGYDATSVVDNLLNDNSSSLSDAEAGMINAKNAYFASLYDDDDSGFWGSWFGRVLGRIINNFIDKVIDNYINNTISGFLTEHLGPGGQIISPIAEDYVDAKIKDVTSVIHIHT